MDYEMKFLNLHTLGAVLSISTVSLYFYYHLQSSFSSRLVYGTYMSMKDPLRQDLARRIDAIVQACPELSRPRYVPTPWAANRWLNLGLFLIKEKFDKYLRVTSYDRKILTMDDGGTVSIDFVDDDTLPDTAPIVIFLHTVTGSSRDTANFVRYAAAYGWRGVVFNRRGHGGLGLTSPKFNLMGDAEDTRAQVDFVTKKFPTSSYLGMVGISAGSGLVVTYLGKEGCNTPVQAACSLCPAYDITQAFTQLASIHPLVDSQLLSVVKNHFISKNINILFKKSKDAVEKCFEARNTHEFLTAHYPFAGFDSEEQYFASNNPMEWVETIARPLMLVNSEDDMVCLPQNIQEDVIRGLGGALLLRTSHGSHIAFNEGAFGTGSYLARITMEFLETARLTENVK